MGSFRALQCSCQGVNSLCTLGFQLWHGFSRLDLDLHSTVFGSDPHR